MNDITSPILDITSPMLNLESKLIGGATKTGRGKGLEEKTKFKGGPKAIFPRVDRKCKFEEPFRASLRTP